MPERNKSIKSIFSGVTYNSGDIKASLAIDEQIATHESYIQHLKQLKKDQDSLLSQTDNLGT